MSGNEHMNVKLRIAEMLKSKKFLSLLVGTPIVLTLTSIIVYAQQVSTVANGDRELGNPLAIPKMDEGAIVDGRRQFRLVMDESEAEFLPGKTTKTAGVNAPYLGPTLRMQRGDLVDLIVENRLAEETTMHWHGMHVPAKMDGTPHQPIEPGETWTASFPIDQQAATLWYHPHPHGNTGPQVYSGIAGQLWIDDEKPKSVDLPNTYGVDDIPVIIQDRNFNNTGNFRFPGRGIGYGNTILINGTLDPFVAVENRQTRFRLLNASNGRVYHVGFEDEREFFQIATDGGLLEHPVPVKRVVLAPGERAELLVDFSDGKPAMLKSFPEAGLIETAQLIFAGAGSGNFNLLRIQPKESTSDIGTNQTKIDSSTVLNKIERIEASSAQVTRRMTLGGRGQQRRRNTGNGDESASEQDEASSTNVAQTGNRRAGGRGAGGRQAANGGAGGGPGQGRPINGKLMDMHRVDERVRFGDTEIWELRNGTQMAHPFHVHLVQFQILDRNGEPPTGVDLGWKDTLLVHPGDEIRIIMRFNKYSDPQTPYMYHCHIMAHEDNGMMGQFLVVKEPERLDLLSDEPTVVVFVMGLDCPHCYEQVKLFDKTLAREKINLIVVTPETAPNSERKSKLSCQVVSDPEKNWAGWFKLVHKGPAHGTLLVDGAGHVQWSATAEEPNMDVEALVRRVRQLRPGERD